MNTHHNNAKFAVLVGLVAALGLVSGCTWDVSEARLKDSVERYEAKPVIAAPEGNVEEKVQEKIQGEIPVEVVEQKPVDHTEGAAIPAFHVDPRKSETLPSGLYEVSWEIQGAKTAYIYGDLFNREDSDLVPLSVPGHYHMNCGFTDGRFLVTYGEGSEIPNDPQAKGYAINEPFLEGVACDNENKDASDDCEGTSPHALDCRVDLVSPDRSLTTGSFFTPNHTSKARLCLVVVGDDGVAKTECQGAAVW